MNAAEIVVSGLPWLRLDVSFDAERLLQEAVAVLPRFVPHRSNGRGWKSLCLHGIGPAQTLAATEYGFAGEAVAPHGWTEIAGACPETARFVRSLPLERLFRVRFMLVEPGGFIAPHTDSELGRLGPINVALNNPPACLFKMEPWGLVPFEPGTAFLIDISNRHAIINMSRTPRFHIIIHSTYDCDNPAWADVVERSYRRTSELNAIPAR